MFVKAGTAPFVTHQDPKSSPMVVSCPSTHLPSPALPPLSGLPRGREVFEGGPVEPALQRRPGYSLGAVLRDARDGPPSPAHHTSPALCSDVSQEGCPVCVKPFSAPAEPIGTTHTQAHPHASLFQTTRAVGDPTCASKALARRDSDLPLASRLPLLSVCPVLRSREGGGKQLWAARGPMIYFPASCASPLLEDPPPTGAPHTGDPSGPSVVFHAHSF